MDNAMVKRGIGAVILAIIAALLLGYLLKDKSDQRQKLVIPSPKTPNIPNLSITDEEKSPLNTINRETAVIANSNNQLQTTLGDDALSKMKAVTNNVVTETNTVESAIINTTPSTPKTDNQETDNKPGFSFRPPSQNEEQKINTTDSVTTEKTSSATPQVADTSETQETVVAASNNLKQTKEDEFKPIIENEPKKKPAKTVIKNVTKKPAKVASSKPEKPKKPASRPKSKPSATNTSEKYTIQLLATSSRSRANKLAETMTSEGYVSFITQTKSNTKILYRVRVGGYKSRSAALKAQQGMKRRYQKNFSVQNSLVVAQ